MKPLEARMGRHKELSAGGKRRREFYVYVAPSDFLIR
jgi:hypothetical protein